jgi:hypothetical protein
MSFAKVPLLHADPHQWGSGKIHQIDDRDCTLCGQSPARCPGQKFFGTTDQITCLKCKQSLEAKERWRKYQVEAQARQRDYEHQRTENDRRWWNAYNAYLETPTWKQKRRLVIGRAERRCEGCGRRVDGLQVHHRHYPRSFPGSDEWIAQEKLFDLVAVCYECHQEIHAREF